MFSLFRSKKVYFKAKIGDFCTFMLIFFSADATMYRTSKKDTLAKFREISVLLWRPNLPRNSKSTRIIWVCIELGIYNFAKATKLICGCTKFKGCEFQRLWYIFISALLPTTHLTLFGTGFAKIKNAHL